VILLGIAAFRSGFGKKSLRGIAIAKHTGGGYGNEKNCSNRFMSLGLTITAIPAGAQTRSRRTYDQRIQPVVIATMFIVMAEAVTGVIEQCLSRSAIQQQRLLRCYGYDNRSVWDKHRDKITTAGGAAAGAIIAD